jgi:membrane fusion protein (multidrug efflux system)
VKRSVKWPLFIFVVLVLLGSGAGLLSLGMRPVAEEGGGEERTVPVTVVTIRKKNFTMTGTYHGRLQAVRDVVITARVGGIIEEDLIDEGDTVEEGQALFRIEENPYRFAMEQAQAALDLARENLRKIRNLSRPEHIRRLEAVVAERETALKKAENDAARFEELHREGAVPLSSKEQIDLLVSALEEVSHD